VTGNDRSRRRFTHDASGAAWEIETVVAPESWATALVNGDWSGLELEPSDAAACRAWIADQAASGWQVVDVARDASGEAEDPWFSWSADLHGSPWRGAELLTYVRERRVPSAGREQED